MSRRSGAHLAARRTALAGLMIAVIEVCKLTLAAMPNIELTSFLLILFSVCFGRVTLFVVPAFILIEGMVYGFGLWWVMYLYAWPLLALCARALPRSDSAFPYAMLSGVFGLLFGLLCSFPYFFIGLPQGISYGLRQMITWWIAGIPFDLVHGVSNFLIMLALYRPMMLLLRRLRALFPDV